jgi:hypothetical protein
VRSIDRFDDSFAPLIEVSGREFDLIQERTPAFLQWRYCDARGGRFVVLAAELGGEVAGYLALKIADGLAYVLDLVAAPATEAADALLAAAIDSSRRAGMDAIVCRLPTRHPTSELLSRHGFVDTRSAMGYAVSSGRLPLSALRFLEEPGARLHLMLGDVDWC